MWTIWPALSRTLLVALLTQAAIAPGLPPISWTCPMHPDVIADKAGVCPICKMDLEPVRLDSAWSCPVHTTVTEAGPGSCPICRRTLIQVTVAVSWMCPVHTNVRALEPGTCNVCGRDLVAVRERRPHGDHNPRHGGIFFMAADNWHHVEGTFPKPGVFQLFVYDDYTKPLSAAAFRGRAVTRETFDARSKRTTELEVFALRPSSGGTHLEARIPSAPLPAAITAKVRFSPKGEEYRFDFSFPSYTVEPAPGDAVGSAVPPSPDAAVPDAVPDSTPALLAALKDRGQQVEAFVRTGAYSQVYVPALGAKDVALALEAHAHELPHDRQADVATAVKEVVVAAWLLDLYGDLGDKPKLTGAYEAFARAISDLVKAYAPDR